MLHVLGCIFQQHDLRLVILAGVLCLFACTAAMNLVQRARAAPGRTRNLWLAAAAQIQLVEQAEAGIPLIRADERRLKQVLHNLLGNAIKFTRAGGKVEVRLSRGPEALAIAVSDSGIGMAEKDIPLARERFGQVDSTLARKYEGAGLGLPIAIQIVELHGGKMDIESRLGVGTTVTVHLPANRLVARVQSVAAA